jgi:hypothetical protein
LRVVPLLALVAAGCRSGSGSLSGTVTYQSKPLTGGSVIVYCSDRQIVHGVIGPDGRYAIPDVPRGPAVVTVQTHPRTPFGTRFQPNLPAPVNGPIMPGESGPGVPAAAAIPPKYALPEESGLSVTVGPGPQTYDIDLLP